LCRGFRRCRGKIVMTRHGKPTSGLKLGVSFDGTYGRQGLMAGRIGSLRRDRDNACHRMQSSSRAFLIISARQMFCPFRLLAIITIGLAEKAADGSLGLNSGYQSSQFRQIFPICRLHGTHARKSAKGRRCIRQPAMRAIAVGAHALGQQDEANRGHSCRG